ncbi:MAG: sn-glycerol-1-phosphate dehydrogenase [Ruminococcaceae bacterium]|jgi:glycerol-1-phosphate dehydrogenase [NAD(P)+]|nr:sn-glycerol-1-phosphate dehydrogenase [Oscillospiraceae bacterium]
MFEHVLNIMNACPCGRRHTLLTEECVVSKDAAVRMKDYIRKKGWRAPAVVADENTRIFADRLLAEFPAKVTTVAGNAHATEIWCAKVGAFCDEEKPDVLIACGSGSVHDITRYVACEKKLPFLSYPTAASVDGFVSGVAAMTWHGQKLTFPSVPPVAAFADPEVFSSAPGRLTASGVGDVLGKYVSLFDWRAGQIFTGEYLCEELCSLESEAVDEVIGALENRGKIGEAAYCEKVMNALLISGLTIQLSGNSRPASAAEHHLSHLWEMHRINETNDGLHGEQVAVGLLLAARRYEKAFRDGLDYEKIAAIDPVRVMDRNRLEPIFRDLTDGILRENQPDGTPASSSLARIRLTGDTDARLREAARTILPPSEEIERLLKLAGTPVTTAEIGLDPSPEFAAKSLAFAPYVRDRLTLLKVLAAAELD